MGYQEIWAPWRLAYVTSTEKKSEDLSKDLVFPEGADPNCFICQAAADGPEHDAARYVLQRNEHSLVIMNRYPYNNGHLLITPRRHVGRLEQLTREEHLELMETLSRIVPMMERIMNCDGFNVGLNLGRVAGAGLPGHLHWHLVPRWNGDTNFMPVLACTNVIPQSMEALWEVLYRELNPGIEPEIGN
ncbi:MAG: HIT domain-containing protein [Thermoguttaceae bacterium]|nr:HIT domain-containing protein [Thermoguttaceae bacterium]